jgi:hypothetical protein
MEVIIQVRENVRNFALGARSLICHHADRRAHLKGNPTERILKLAFTMVFVFVIGGGWGWGVGWRWGVGWGVIQLKVDDVFCFKLTL